MTLSPSNLMRNSLHIHQSVCFKPENNVSLSYRNIAALSLILGVFLSRKFGNLDKDTPQKIISFNLLC